MTSETPIPEATSEADNDKDNKKSHREFGHGTSREYAFHIQTIGLNATVATAASRRGRGNRPGSFHTYEIPSLEQAPFILSEAAQWALRHAPREEAAVVILTLPEETYTQILQEGWAIIEPVPGMENDPTYPPQTVFTPESYALINDEGRFDVIPLVERENE